MPLAKEAIRVLYDGTYGSIYLHAYSVQSEDGLDRGFYETLKYPEGKIIRRSLVRQGDFWLYKELINEDYTGSDYEQNELQCDFETGIKRMLLASLL